MCEKKSPGLASCKLFVPDEVYQLFFKYRINILKLFEEVLTILS
jgi:hypothetical protein